MFMEKYKLVDVHAHICDDQFDADREDVLDRARIAGVESIVAVGEDLPDARKNVALAEKFPMLKPAAGLYPTIVDLKLAQEMTAFIREHHHLLAAIGEVGLDYWAIQEPDERQLQKEIFTGFIDLSKQLNLPLNIHSRSAGRHVIALLLERDAQLVHLHAFDGKYGAAMPAVEAGFYFSIPPSVVRSRQKQKLVKQLPLSRLMVESDSPVLGPDPQQRNEPTNVSVAIEAIGQIKGVSRQRVITAVEENTRRLYGL